MDRRLNLASLLLLIAIAGCLGGPGVQATDSSTPPATSSATPTPGTTACPETPGSTDVSVPPWPDRPDEFTNETVLEFAHQFERAYVTRQTLQENQENTRDYTSVSIRIDADFYDNLEPNVTRSGNGWIVHFNVTGPYQEWNTEADSSGPGHSLPPSYIASYRITENRIVRAHAVEAVDPRTNGSVVQCPPE